MYGHASQPTRVYAYGAKAPSGNADLAAEALTLARRYRNNLVEAEIDRRAAANEVIRAHYPTLTEMDARIESIEKEIDEVRAAIRKDNSSARRRAPDPARRRAIRDRRADLKGMRREHKDLRKHAYADERVRADLKAVDETHSRRCKDLRANCGVHWGTYLAVEQGLSGMRTGAPPRFVGRQWPGKLAVQCQGGASWDDLVAGHTQAHIEVLPPPSSAKPGGRRSRRPKCRVRLRIGSEGRGNRTPVWATIPFVLHRPIPVDAQVKWIYATRRMRGTNAEWQVQFAVSREAWVHQDTANATGVCGIDFGWRTLPNGSLRVAYAVGSDGAEGELVIPTERLARWRKLQDLQSIRDRQFGDARTRLVNWLKAADVPDWFEDATESASRWRSPARLAGLVIRFGATSVSRQTGRHLRRWRYGVSRTSISTTGRATSQPVLYAGGTTCTAVSRRVCDGAMRLWWLRTHRGPRYSPVPRPKTTTCRRP